jgi:hypothetical protein
VPSVAETIASVHAGPPTKAIVGEITVMRVAGGPPRAATSVTRGTCQVPCARCKLVGARSCPSMALVLCQMGRIARGKHPGGKTHPIHALISDQYTQAVRSAATPVGWIPPRALLLESHPDAVGRIRFLHQNHKHISLDLPGNADPRL